MSDRPRPQLTLVGMPAFVPPPEEEPIPLTPYRDVHVYTPSHARARVEATPVILPPPPEPRRKQQPTIMVRRPEPTPTMEAMLYAAGLAMFATAAIVAWLF